MIQNRPCRRKVSGAGTWANGPNSMGQQEKGIIFTLYIHCSKCLMKERTGLASSRMSVRPAPLVSLHATLTITQDSSDGSCQSSFIIYSHERFKNPRPPIYLPPTLLSMGTDDRYATHHHLVCESLRSFGKWPVRAVLHATGDGIYVVKQPRARGP